MGIAFGVLLILKIFDCLCFDGKFKKTPKTVQLFCYFHASWNMADWIETAAYSKTQSTLTEQLGLPKP